MVRGRMPAFHPLPLPAHAVRTRSLNGGALVSTGMRKQESQVEAPLASLKSGKPIVANNDYDYALAA